MSRTSVADDDIWSELFIEDIRIMRAFREAQDAPPVAFVEAARRRRRTKPELQHRDDVAELSRRAA